MENDVECHGELSQLYILIYIHIHRYLYMYIYIYVYIYNISVKSVVYLFSFISVI